MMIRYLRVLMLAAFLQMTISSPFSMNEVDEMHADTDSEVVVEDEVGGEDITGAKASMKWNKIAQDELNTVLKIKDNIKRAKNVIFFLGDGMGPTSVTAARWYMSESRKTRMEDTAFTWEKFEHSALSRTYNTDRMTPDSAGTATAYLCGVKTNLRVIGYNQNVKQYNCDKANDENKVFSILHDTKKSKKKWTGVVTVTRVTHATPAGTYAHTPGRNWEASIPKEIPNGHKCKDIAWQLVNENNDIRVVMGGGHQNFVPESEGGKRKDGKNLIKEWVEIQEKKGGDADKVKFVETQDDLHHVDPTKVDYLMGLFAKSHMNFEIDRLRDEKNTQPSLVEMTEKAIKVLQQADDGFFLLVEGGLIDHGHHKNRAFAAFNDTVMFSDAVKKAMELTNREDTLIVVTADHSHTITMGGYPVIRNGILGVVNTKEQGYNTLDNKPRLTINYANGPGYAKHRLNSKGKHQARKDVSKDDTKSPDYIQDAAVPRHSETHGGEDVAIYATGPMSHLFKGVHQQNYIKHALAYASCVGPNLGHCNGKETKDDGNSASIASVSAVVVMICSLFSMVFLR